MLAALPFFRVSNYIEAAFWIVVAAGFVVATYGSRRAARCWTAAIVFALFGASDIVEASTGAWYRPLWLLVWKGLCLLVILALLVGYIREKRR